MNAITTPHRIRILIVENEDPILTAMQKYLTLRGYNVDCAREREEAEALLANITYAAVIADLRLTGISGNEGLEIVRYIHERCPKTRVIILTAYISPEMEVEARCHGVDALLLKPTPLAGVAQVIQDMLEIEQ